MYSETLIADTRNDLVQEREVEIFFVDDRFHLLVRDGRESIFNFGDFVEMRCEKCETFYLTNDVSETKNTS